MQFVADDAQTEFANRAELQFELDMIAQNGLGRRDRFEEVIVAPRLERTGQLYVLEVFGWIEQRVFRVPSHRHPEQRIFDNDFGSDRERIASLFDRDFFPWRNQSVQSAWVRVICKQTIMIAIDGGGSLKEVGHGLLHFECLASRRPQTCSISFSASFTHRVQALEKLRPWSEVCLRLFSLVGECVLWRHLAYQQGVEGFGFGDAHPGRIGRE